MVKPSATVAAQLRPGCAWQLLKFLNPRQETAVTLIFVHHRGCVHPQDGPTLYRRQTERELLKWSCQSGAIVRNAGVESMRAGKVHMRFPPELVLCAVLLDVDLDRLAGATFGGIEEAKPIEAQDGRHGSETALVSAC